MNSDSAWESASQSSSFCALLWMHAAVRPGGRVQPCCRFQEDGTTLKENETLQDALESPRFQEIREKMLRGEEIPGCRQCIQEEKLQARSKRMAINEDYRALWEPTPRLRYVEFPLGNLCNLKCRGCHSSWSTKWAADEIKLGIPEEFIVKRWENSTDLLDGSWSELRIIKILGGEPFLAPNHESFLEKIDRYGDISKVSLHYASNGTQRPSPFVLGIWKKLKHLSIDFSIDGLREKNDYFREGSRWREVIENIHWFRENVAPENRAFEIHSVVNAYNIHDVFEIDEWLSAEFPEFFLTKACLTDPPVLAIQNLPNDEKEKLIRYYADCEKKPRLTNARRRWYRAFQNFLKQPPLRAFDEFVAHDRKVSEIRNRKLENYHPELARLAMNPT